MMTRYFCNGWSSFHLWNTVRKIKSFSLLLDTPAISLNVLSTAKSNGIVMLCLPPYCKHRLQPIDASFYGPLKTYDNQEGTQSGKNNNYGIFYDIPCQLSH
jgi:hypothetical protein